MQTEEKTAHLEGTGLADGRFVIGKFLSGGAFGGFHFGVENSTKLKVGIKLEAIAMAQPQLQFEFAHYTHLKGPRFIPKVHFFGRTEDPKFHALVMDVLGPSLKSMQKKCGGRFSILTTTQLMIQLVEIMEYVHDRGIVYRDIKPDNFLLGLPNTDMWWTVNLIDLGFAKSYIIPGANAHIPFTKGKPAAGTARFLSIKNHAGHEVGRRDDLEALIYMAIFMFRGNLPWIALPPGLNQGEQNRLIGRMKFDLTPEELCKNMPPCYCEMRKHLNTLKMEDRPAYRHWIALMRGLLLRLGHTMEEMIYDWDAAHEIVRNKHFPGDKIPGASQQE